MKGHKAHHGHGHHEHHAHHAHHAHKHHGHMHGMPEHEYEEGMKKHHRKARKHGGAMDLPHEGKFASDKAPKEVYEGAGSHVVKEAEAKKRGGRAKKHLGHVHGEHAHKRHDRPARKSGGRTGSNFSPLSSAHKGTEPKKHKSYEPEVH
jgi:hypothetical protein